MKKSIHRSIELFNEAQKYIPGGVNSPVRAFGSVGGTPVFIQRAQGPWLYDTDDNRYLDLLSSWGPMILGHRHPAVEQAIIAATSKGFSYGTPTEMEVEMAKLICRLVPSIEKVRLVNSGTEATLSAIRLARGYTNRSKIIKFEGCYHGHGDSFLIAAGSGALTFGVPDSSGITKGIAEDTLTAPYNDLNFVETLVEANKNQIAAIILEPVVGNMGLVLPEQGFLSGLRKICNAENILLIFDEVMTGFRLALGGAQERFEIIPDLTTLGKIIGGGLPVGAYGGKAEIMNCVAPVGTVYQAGTLSGNPIAVAAGYATLSELLNHPEHYQTLEKLGKSTEEGIQKILQKNGSLLTFNRIGSMFTLFFTQKPVRNLTEAKLADTKQYAAFFHHLLNFGIHPAASQFEAMFLNLSMTNAEIEFLLTGIESFFQNTKN
ncbi:MAG: glutamate-1-semialdehyde 2,1-aminomutase [Bacteroidia bacterium]|nr:glutamate-1-semialdehyde 2,1-aminomutase [Bacteroidia bacterium]